MTGRPALVHAAEAAVQNGRLPVAEILEKPEGARRANAGVGFVDDDRTIGRHAAKREQVANHPHEGAERRVARVDQAHAPEIEVHRAGNMADGKRLGRPDVDHERAWRDISEKRHG